MARKERPMSQAEKDRLSFLKKTRQVLKPFDIDPEPYSGWTVGIGQSTPFSSDEESEADEEKEESKEDESEETSAPSLPPPEDIHPIFQAEKTDSEMKTPSGLLEPARKDLNAGYYKQAQSRKSTRVQALQWIPMNYGENEEGEESVTGDILVAFARPSRNQAGPYGALYFTENAQEATWRALENGDSFGIGVDKMDLRKFDEDAIPAYLENHKDKTVSYWIWQDSKITTNRDAGDIERIKAGNAAVIAGRLSDAASRKEKNRKRPFKPRPKK
jgi:hypothetical protein